MTPAMWFLVGFCSCLGVMTLVALVLVIYMSPVDCNDGYGSKL